MIVRFAYSAGKSEGLNITLKDTIKNVIPKEVDYLSKYDEMKRFLDDYIEMPDKTVALLVRFLEQNNGKLLKRVRTKEFEALTDQEVREIENRFHEIFLE
jgi:hypothetical protein